MKISIVSWAFGFLPLILAAPALPVTHAVQFGGAMGFSYYPNSFAAAVGDTVRWSGDFAMHPLSSTGIPAGALSWHNGSGGSFSYTIRVAGHYGYQCDIHLGMNGSFDAMNLGLEEKSFPDRSRPLSLADIAPNPSFDNDVTIRFVLGEPQRITLKLYSMQGDRVLTLDRGIKEAGSYQIIFPSKRLASGAYVCRLEGRTTDTRRLLFVR